MTPVFGSFFFFNPNFGVWRIRWKLLRANIFKYRFCEDFLFVGEIIIIYSPFSKDVVKDC